MNEVDRKNNQGRNLKLADARILGQILAAQNILFVLPDEARIAEFYSQALRSVPGVTTCFVCLGGLPAPAMASSEVCHECAALRKKEPGMHFIPNNFSCELAASQNWPLIRVGTNDHTFGFFIFHTDRNNNFEPYWPFLNNLANYVALSLENRMQKLQLEKARDEMEDKVILRTKELMTLNTLLEEEIRDRRVAEEAFSKEKDRSQSYLDIAGVMLIGLNEIGHIVLINKKGCEVLGYREEDLLGKDWFTSCLPLSIRDKVKSNFLKIISGQENLLKQNENTVLTKSGEERIIDWRNSVLRDKNGEIIGIFSSGEDISDRKQVEEEIRTLNRELEQRVIQRTAQLEATNKELEAFAYSVSHDLRAPLRGIDGFSQALLEDYHDEIDTLGKNYLQRVRSAAQRMAQLIDDMLSLSRVSRTEINIQHVNLSEIVREITNDLKTSHPERKVEFIIQEGINVQGDIWLLRTVLENLIRNAWKFTSKHETARIEFGMQQKNDKLPYFIRDDGAGFDMKYSQRLFGAFQRLHTVAEFPGTGIGLATVQRIIHRLGGEVWAEGEVEKGATFYFTIPME